VRQLRRADEQDLVQGKTDGALDDGHPVICGGESDAMDLSQHLREDVGAGECRALLGDDVDGDDTYLGEHLVGEVVGAQQRQVVAVPQRRDPRNGVGVEQYLRALSPTRYLFRE